VPIVWAACIFLWPIQVWWAIIDLPELAREWTIGEFAMLLGMTLQLSIAAALILPVSESFDGETMAAEFQCDGRWALAFLASYFAFAIVLNWWLFDTPPYECPACPDFLLVILPVLFLISKSRRNRIIATLHYAVAALWSAWEMSSHAY
jgi:hypothetical protein